MKTFTDKVIRDRVDWYFNNRETIISNTLRTDFLKSAKASTDKEQQFARSFAVVSLFAEDLFNDSDTKATDRHKELMIEGIFSAYEYLTENHNDLYSNFDTFMKTLDENLNVLQFKELLNKSQTFGFFQFDTLSLKSSLDKLDEDYDYLFLNIFEHELTHALSLGDNTTGFIRTGGSKLRYGPYNVSFNYNLDEDYTEKMAENFLKKNFEDIITYNEFPIYFTNDKRPKEKSKTFEATLNISRFNYKEGAIVSDVLDTLFSKQLQEAYLDDDNSLKKFLDESPLKSQIKNVRNNYNEFVRRAHNYGLENQTFSLPKLIDLNNSLVDLINEYDRIYGLSDEEYFKVTDCFKKNSLTIEGFPHFNDNFVTRLDFDRFGKDLESLTDNEIKSILDCTADEVEYKDYYDLLENVNADREDYIDATIDKDIISISYPKEKEALKYGDNIKIKKEDSIEFDI